MSIQV